MAKTRQYFYECVMKTEIRYMAPEHRKERIRKGQVPPMVVHRKVFRPANWAVDPPRPADVLVTERPLAPHFVREVAKKISRLDLETHKRALRETHSKVKFRLLEADEVGEGVKGRAVALPMLDDDFETEGA